MGLMRYAVEQRCGHAGVTKYLCPVSKTHIGGYDEICVKLGWKNQEKINQEKINFPIEFLFAKSLLEQFDILEENGGITKDEEAILISLSSEYENDLWMFQKRLLSDNQNRYGRNEGHFV